MKMTPEKRKEIKAQIRKLRGDKGKKEDPDKITKQDIKRLKRILNHQESNIKRDEDGLPLTLDDAKKHTYVHWLVQPVQQFDSPLHNDSTIEELAPVEIKLPDDHTWSNDKDIDFLNKNYNGKFTPVFTPDLLSLMIRGDHIVNTIKCADETIGMIGGVVSKMKYKGKYINTLNVELLCVSKEHRHNGVAELLMDKLRNDSLEKGLNMGIFITNRIVPTPLCEIETYHRPLDIEKLVEVGMVEAEDTEMETLIDHYAYEKELSDNVRLATHDDIEDICDLYHDYVCKFMLFESFQLNDIRDIFINNEAVHTYVITDGNDVVDFFSVIIYDETNGENTVKRCRLYYYSANINTYFSVVREALALACDKECDIFDVPGVQNNININDTMGFNKGPKRTYYNFYNYRTVPITSESNGMVSVLQ